MSFNRKDARAIIADQLRPAFNVEKARLDRIDRWLKHNPEPLRLPRNATQEIRELADLARTPWLGLVVSVLSQAAFVDGYRSPDERENAPGPWRTWNGNDLDSRQVAIHRAAFGYGYAFATVLPGVAPDGSPMSRIRGVSPRRLQAFYLDPAEDDWCAYALQVEPQPRNLEFVYLYDDEFKWTFTTEGGLQYVTHEAHGADRPPIVRYANQLDLEGRADGEVEPFIPLAAKINKTDFDRLLAQHFQSWQVRYATGMAMPDDQEQANADAAAAKLRIRHEDILIAEDPEAKFGVLPGTPLDGLIAAKRSDVETLAAASQTPTSALTGDLINISSDGLVAARAQLDQKLAERKTSLGRSHAQALRLAAALEGNMDAANDVMARVTWQDTSIRSLSTAADALGKIASMLGVPVQALWSRIPGVTRSDVEDWQKMAAQGDPIESLNRLLTAQVEAAPPAAA